MRDIKFRGLSINSEQWVESLTVGRGIVKRKSRCLYLEIESMWVGIIPESLGQFTGFIDKNGIEIFEGDIISDWTDTDEGLVQSKNQVFWNSPTGSWHLDNSFKQDKTCSTELWSELNDFQHEVTGNIYEKKLSISNV